jgi:tetratricopeptide (TPR) repeat protein
MHRQVTFLRSSLKLNPRMIRCLFLILFSAGGICPAFAQSNTVAMVQRQWFETRTAHFNVYSCGAPREVYKLAARLEQFCEAYTLLTQTASAVASPPIVVMAFPDHEAMKPFLPLYQGKPANLAAFFQRGSDENLIVLGLPGSDSGYTDLEVIFHEYTHLLLRHNDRDWPLWLKEGMAEAWSTFETSGYNVQIGKPIDHHLRLLAQQPLMPLAELFGVVHDSPQYNERDRQGIFYAESWLLTEFLMTGDRPEYKARFAQFMDFLQQGQLPVPAFTNAMQATLPVMENELRRYLKRGQFTPVNLTLQTDISSPVNLTTRKLATVETYFRLGDELLRIDRPDTAELYFKHAQKLAPDSPLPCEGLGLLAAERKQHEAALRNLDEALQRGSTSFLAYYVFAREKYRLTADAQDRYAPLKNGAAADIRGGLQKSLALMPDFASANELLGFFEMVQGENLAAAEQYLRRAIELERENPSYRFSLAQLQLRSHNAAAARQTLQPLLLPNVDAKLRTQAETMLREMAKGHPAY